MKDHGSSNGRADSLTKQDLIVFSCNTSHHETEDVQKRAGDQQGSRAEVIEDFADKEAAEEHKEDCLTLSEMDVMKMKTMNKRMI